MRDIADEFKVSSPAATAIIDRLVEDKHIERVTDSTDRRIVRLRLTKLGKQTLDTGMRDIHESLRSKMEILSVHEQKQLFTILRKLIGTHA